MVLRSGGILDAAYVHIVELEKVGSFEGSEYAHVRSEMDGEEEGSEFET